MPLLKKENVLIVASFIFLASAQNAQAYLDPGTGSFIFQILIAGALGIMLVVKSSWLRIMAIVNKLFGKKREVNKED